MSLPVVVPKPVILIVVDEPREARDLEDAAYAFMPEADIRLSCNSFSAAGPGSSEGIACQLLSSCAPDILIFKVRNREAKCLEVVHWMARRMGKSIRVLMYSANEMRRGWMCYEAIAFHPGDANMVEFRRLFSKVTR